MSGLDVNSFEQDFGLRGTKRQQCVLAVFQHFHGTISLNRRGARCITSSFYRRRNSRRQDGTRWIEFSGSEVTSHSILGRRPVKRAAADAVVCCRWSRTGPDVLFHPPPQGICCATGCPENSCVAFSSLSSVGFFFFQIQIKKENGKIICWHPKTGYCTWKSCSSRILQEKKLNIKWQTCLFPSIFLLFHKGNTEHHHKLQ